jgi:hypothetical protein
MKVKAIMLLLGGFILLGACSKDNEEPEEVDNTGVLKFQTLNPLTSSKTSNSYVKSIVTNPPLTGPTTVTINTSMKVCVGDIWVSQGEVKAGNPDDLTWIRLTDVTNKELKLFEDYSFTPKELPTGTYKSIKISLKNIWYRHCELLSDATVKYELLETMGSSFAPCDENDTSWVKPNYFSTDGNHKLNDEGLFELVAPGEKVGGFEVKKGETAILTWRLGAGATEPCINYLVDENGNLEWDCGIDYIDIECPPEMEYMFDFVVGYE